MFEVWLPWAKIDPLVISFDYIILGFFDSIKFVIFRKSRGHVLELYAKQKVPWFPSKFNFSTKNGRKLTTLWSPCMDGVYLSQSHYKETVFFVSLSSRSFWYSFDWARKDQSLSQLWVTQCFWAWDP